MIEKIKNFRFKLSFTLRDIEGRELPKGYGISNIDYLNQQVTLHLMPFNFLIMYARFVYQKLKNPNIQDVFNEAYTIGFELGQQEGRLDAALELKQMLSKMGANRNAKQKHTA